MTQIGSAGNIDEVRECLIRLLFHLRDVPSTSPTDMRARILSTAIPMFAGRGYVGTSMRDIATGVNIKAASLYSHFPGGKEQLLREGLSEIFDEFLAHIVAPLSPNMDVPDQLRCVVEQHVRWQLESAPKALAWDAALAQFGVEGVLDPAYEQELRLRQNLYHAYVERLVHSITSDAISPARALGILALCDAARIWHVSGGGSLDSVNEVVEVVWTLAQDVSGLSRLT